MAYGRQNLGRFYAANLLSGLLACTQHQENTRHGGFYDIFPLPWIAESNRCSNLLPRVR